ncbi:MAG: hypothetical protein LBQ27_02855 [Clostridiales bacterium]|nr:hypothetical protein [Clostridiales bacterium]
MRKKKGLALFVLFAVFIVLSASMNNIDLNKRALVIGVGIDRENDEYELTIQTFVAKQLSDSTPNNSEALTVSAKGRTVDEVITKLNIKTGKTLSFALCYVIILGEGMAESDVIDELDFLVNKSDTANNAMLLLCESKAKDMMKINSPISSGSMMLLHDMLSDKQCKPYAPKTIKDFNADYYSLSATSIVPILKKSEGGSDTENNNQGGDDDSKEKRDYYEMNTAAIFKNGKYVLSLDEEETIAYGFLTGSRVKDRFGVAFDDKIITFNADRKHIKKKYDLNKRSYTVELKIFLDASEIVKKNGKPHADKNSQTQMANIRMADEDKKAIEAYMKSEIISVIEKCENEDIDILLLSDNFYRRYGKKARLMIEEGKFHEKISKEVKVSVELV